MPSLRILRWSLAAIVALATTTPVPAASPDYVLGPQDKLRIKVYDWRNGPGDAHEWLALNGEYIVGSAGFLSLPLIGEVPAAGATTSTLAHALAKILQDKVGLAQRPDAAVEVVDYRPFYILGLVEKSGEYAYRPGLTVLQAVSLAGGLARASDQSLIGFERDAIVSRGDLHSLTAERDSLAVRKARLDAEIAGSPSIVFGPNVMARKAVPSVMQAIDEEQSILANTRQEQADDNDALTQARTLLLREIGMLGEKDASLAHQYDLAKKELDLVSGLVDRGMAVVPRKLALEQNASQFESSRLDVQLATMRAQEEIGKINRSLVELQTKRRTLALSEASETGARLAALDERISTATRLIYQAEVRSPELVRDADQSLRLAPVYSLTRVVDGLSKTDTVGESDVIQPGDTVRVERRPAPKDFASERAPAAQGTVSATPD